MQDFFKQIEKAITDSAIVSPPFIHIGDDLAEHYLNEMGKEKMQQAYNEGRIIISKKFHKKLFAE